MSLSALYLEGEFHSDLPGYVYEALQIWVSAVLHVLSSLGVWV